MSRHLFSRDRDRYGYQVTIWHGEEAERAAKDLGLPARSRFGEGRAKPLIDPIRTLQSQANAHFK
jgi:hypothetical protein